MQLPFISRINPKKLIAIGTLGACLSAGLLVIQAQGSASSTNFAMLASTPTGTAASLKALCRDEDNNKDFAKALTDCTNAIKSDPKFPDAYYYRGLEFGVALDCIRAIGKRL